MQIRMGLKRRGWDMGFWRGGEVEGGLGPEVVFPQSLLEDGEVGRWGGEVEGVLGGSLFPQNIHSTVSEATNPLRLATSKL